MASRMERPDLTAIFIFHMELMLGFVLNSRQSVVFTC